MWDYLCYILLDCIIFLFVHTCGIHRLILLVVRTLVGRVLWTSGPGRLATSTRACSHWVESSLLWLRGHHMSHTGTYKITMHSIIKIWLMLSIIPVCVCVFFLTGRVSWHGSYRIPLVVVPRRPSLPPSPRLSATSTRPSPLSTTHTGLRISPIGQRSTRNSPRRP